MYIQNRTTVAPRTLATTPAEPGPAPQEGENEELKLMVLGDSLTAGMQDVNMREELQAKNFGALIARQAGVGFEQPMISGNGIPPLLFDRTNAGLGRAVWRYSQVIGAMLGPMTSLALGIVPHEILLYPLYHAGGVGSNQSEDPESVQNVAIPGYELRHLTEVSNVYDLMEEVADGAESATPLAMMLPTVRQVLQSDRRAGNGRSQVQRAIDLQPDVVTLWAGNNDALSTALAGSISDSELTPIEDRPWNITNVDHVTGETHTRQTKVMTGFKNAFDGPNGALTRLLENTQAEIAVMNVPDVTVIPHLFTVGERIGRLPFRLVLPTGHDITDAFENFVIPNEVKGAEGEERTNFPAGTQVGLGSILGKFVSILSSDQEPEQAIDALAAGPLFEEGEVLDPEELDYVNERIDQYNAIIAEAAANNDRVHLVDVHELLDRAKAEGLELRGDGAPIRVAPEYTGQRDSRGFEGIFSYDGVHPSDIGQAVIANQILDVLRSELPDTEKFASLKNAPVIDEIEILKDDPHRGERPALVLTPLAPDLIGK